MGNFLLLKWKRPMRTLLFLMNSCILLSLVQAKSFSSSNHAAGTNPVDSQSFPLYEEIPLKSPNIASTKIGKPLYFGREPFITPSESEKNESPLTDRYELSNYETLEGMFDTQLKFPEKFKPQSKIEFQEDQVFLHDTQIKITKSNTNLGETPKNFEKKDLKSSGAQSPCEGADLQDYTNKSANQLASSINLHNVMYGSTYELKSPRKMPEAISEDFHQHENKIMHKNLHQTKNANKTPLEGTTGEESGYTTENNVNSESIDNKLTMSTNLEAIITSKMEENVDALNQRLDATEFIPPGRPAFTKAPGEEGRSFVFNPNAQPQELFQECRTPKNESGHCRYIQHCLLPSVLASIRHFMENVCIIQDQFLGVCCPQFPVSVVLVSWPDQQFAEDSVQVPEDCGIGTNRRIVGGLAAGRKAWPWMVALLNNKNKFFCGGSLINNRYVLTAAHCTFGPPAQQIVARLGEYDLSDPNEPHTDYPVSAIKRHGRYARFTLRHDVALLQLGTPVLYDEAVRPICLPERGHDYLGRHATLAGWGHVNGESSSRRSDVLQEASLTIIGNDECGVSHGVPLVDSILCAAAPTKDRGACNGDSGGPLMLLDTDQRWKVVGIVSWGRRGCNPHFPTAYSRVTHYLDWIKEHAT